MRAVVRSALLLVVVVASVAAGQETRAVDGVYADAATRLIGAALADEDGYAKLAYLTTEIGNRLSGSAGLERAVAWVDEQMRADGLANVRRQPIKVPHWVRGSESAEIIAPVRKPIGMLGLGRSVATPPEGITAPVVVVGSFDELDRLGGQAKGKIVVYDMPWMGYARTQSYRTTGASRAAKLGAVAALVRSLTPRSLYTPHTGSLNYDAASPRIPAAAITVEDARWIREMTSRGHDVRVRLQMGAQTLADTDSANVIGELVGRERPDEVVVVGGHLDSWDVGQGAHDDGAGIVAAWHAVVLMKKLGLTPRRTIRVVAWTNEENGVRGGNGYRDALGTAIGMHVAAIEMDEGAERPIGFGYDLSGVARDDPRFLRAASLLQEIARLLEPVGSNRFEPGGGETDIEPLMRGGVPGFGLRTVDEHYFDWHHTNADTLDKIDLEDFRRCIASMAVLAYVLADMPDRI
jgi:hypothetical protein